MIMTMSQLIAQTKSCHQVHLQDKEVQIPTQDATIDLPLAMTIKAGTVAMTIEIDIDLAGQDPILTVTDTGVTVKVTHKGVAPGHTTDPHTTPHPATETQADTAIDETPHTEDPHHTEVSPEIAVDPDHVHHTKTIT